MIVALCLLLAPAPELPVSVFVHVARKKASNANLIRIDLTTGTATYDDGRTHRLKISPTHRAILTAIRDAMIAPGSTSVRVEACDERPYDWRVKSVTVEDRP